MMAKYITQQRILEILNTRLERAGTKRKLADEIGIDRRTLGLIMNGRAPVGPDVQKFLGLQGYEVWTSIPKNIFGHVTGSYKSALWYRIVDKDKLFGKIPRE